MGESSNVKVSHDGVVYMDLTGGNGKRIAKKIIDALKEKPKSKKENN